MKENDKLKKPDDLNSGAIAGIVLGVLAFIAIILYTVPIKKLPPPPPPRYVKFNKNMVTFINHDAPGSEPPSYATSVLY